MEAISGRLPIILYPPCLWRDTHKINQKYYHARKDFKLSGLCLCLQPLLSLWTSCFQSPLVYYSGLRVTFSTSVLSGHCSCLWLRPYPPPYKLFVESLSFLPSPTLWWSCIKLFEGRDKDSGQTSLLTVPPPHLSVGVENRCLSTLSHSGRWYCRYANFTAGKGRNRWAVTSRSNPVSFIVPITASDVRWPLESLG